MAEGRGRGAAGPGRGRGGAGAGALVLGALAGGAVVAGALVAVSSGRVGGGWGAERQPPQVLDARYWSLRTGSVGVGGAGGGESDCSSAGSVTEACRGSGAGALGGRGGEPGEGAQGDGQGALSSDEMPERRQGEYMEWPPTHENYALDRELVELVARDNVVLVTWANFHYLDFAENWVAHVKKCGITNYLVGAMDQEMLEALHARGIHTFSMSSGTPTSDFGWGTPTFFKMGQEKIQLVQTFLGFGFETFVTDIDTAIMRDPFPLFARYPWADILVSSDGLVETDKDSNGETLEVPRLAGAAYNIGIMFFRPKALELVKEWVEVIMADIHYWDQQAFNDLARRGATWEDEGHRLFKAYDGKLIMGILPTSTFANGNTFYVQHMFERLTGADPYIVHNTFQYSGTPGKRHRFREFMIWEADSEEYYDPPGGLLTYSAEIPKELLQHASGTAPTGADAFDAPTLTLNDTAGHFSLVNWQLTRLRNAAAVATALGRVLVMPELHCGMDRWWAPHNGVIPGSGLVTPFVCPLDQVLDLEIMAKMDTEKMWDEYGPPLRYREYSFMRNPHVPSTVKDSVAFVRVCDASMTGGCSDDSSETLTSETTVPKGLKSDELKEALTSVESAKVLHFSDMEGFFGGFSEEKDEAKFVRRVVMMPSIWCCVQPEEEGQAGHVFYDLLWDIPGGHTDKHMRALRPPWVPLAGP